MICPFDLRRHGITKFLIQEGLAKLEEQRDSDGKLENVIIRVRPLINALPKIELTNPRLG